MSEIPDTAFVVFEQVGEVKDIIAVAFSEDNVSNAIRKAEESRKRLWMWDHDLLETDEVPSDYTPGIYGFEEHQTEVQIWELD